MQGLAALWRRIVALFRRDHGGLAAQDSDRTQDSGRRKVLVGGATVGAVAASAVLLPKSWTTPVLRSVVVPAHAETTVVTKKATKTTDKPKHKPKTTPPTSGTVGPPPTTFPPTTTTSDAMS